MGYRIRFSGQFNLDRPLTLEQYNTLIDFAKEDHRKEALVPGVWCDWIPTRDGKAIVCAGNDLSFYGFDEWLTYLIDTFLAPWGYTVNGSVRWQGAEVGDTGTLTVHNNRVLKVEDKDALVAGRVYALFVKVKGDMWQLQLNGNGSGQLQNMVTESAHTWKTLEEAEKVLQDLIDKQS